MELRDFLLSKLNIYSGIVKETELDDEAEQAVLDIRWRGDVHFVFYMQDRQGHYGVERDGQLISESFWVRQPQKEEALLAMQRLIDDIEAGRYQKKKTPKELIREEVQKRGLTGYMNNTKWQKLLDELKSIPDILLQYKLLFDEEVPKQYWTLQEDEEILYINHARIEWMKIKPIVEKMESVGRLMDVKKNEIDNSARIETILQTLPIEYNEADGIFTIYGWK